MKKVTILTPTYNRAKELKKLFVSLDNQTCCDFEWIIIDDGSSDETKATVEEFDSSNFPIKYYYKQNGGKHTALNIGFKKMNSECVIIVDSDDHLINTAIERIIKDWEKYKNNSSIAGLVYKKGTIDGKSLCGRFKCNEFIENYNNYVINGNIKNDKAEVFRTSILKEYSYPEFKGERFIGEGYLWSQIARKYNMVFIDEIIYICEYLEGGLTKSGRALRIKCPYGGMRHAEEYLDSIYNIKVREKNALLYIAYANFAKENILRLIKKNKNKILLTINIIPGYMLYMLWKFQHSK